ncbi:unnamed protein product, partial [marine sediment metagenome]
MQNTRNVTVSMYRASNIISLELKSNVDQVFRNAYTTLHLTLRNIGDSELRVLVPNISIGITPLLTATIVEIDYLALEQFKPGDITVILIQIDVLSIEQMNVTVSIEAKNDITDEEINIQVSEMYNVYDVQISDYFMNLLTLIMISIFVLVWVIMFIFV